MAKRESKLNSEECKRSILNYFQIQKKFKDIQAKFNDAKANFYKDMEDFFDCNNIDGKLTIVCDEFSNSSKIVVTRVQSSKVEFNPDKLEKALGKELSKEVIQKRYEVVDMNGLIKYLQEFGVNPKIFKSFISVSKTVNTKELDKLEELGKVTAEQVKGCYTVKSQSPYFTVSLGKGQNNGG